MYRYGGNCVNWKKTGIDAFSEMIDSSTDITRETFMKHVNHEDMAGIAKLLGYVKHHAYGLTMKQDGYVSYHRSKYDSERCYYFCHSAIEYVFFQEEL